MPEGVGFPFPSLFFYEGRIIRDNQLSEETLKTASIKGFQRSCLG